jgi:hypothetical protein
MAQLSLNRGEIGSVHVTTNVAAQRRELASVRCSRLLCRIDDHYGSTLATTYFFGL